MRTPVLALLVTLAGAVGFQQTALGQFSNTTGGSTSSGIFGSRTLGQGSGGRTSALGGTGTGRGAGGSAAGATQNLGLLGTTTGQLSSGARFLRGNAGGFVGADLQDAASFVGRAGAMQGNQRFQAGITQGGRQGAGQGGRGGGRAGRTQTQIRTTVRVGFDYAPTTFGGVSSRLQTRLTESSGIQFLSSVEVALDGSTATLRGLVASEHSRALAEQLARLEPGIWKVRNELEVAAPASASEPSLLPSPAPQPLPASPPSP